MALNATIPNVIEQHAEEAAFHWLRRAAAVHAPHYTLADLAALDNHLDAHLDGLIIAGHAGWALCKDALHHEEAGEVFAASVLAFHSGVETRIQTVLDVAHTSVELSRGLVSALGWLPFADVRESMAKLCAAASPGLRRMGIAAFALHRHNPGLPLIQALDDTDDSLRARALRTVGELGLTDLLPMVHAHLDSQHRACQFYAAWSAARLGANTGLSILRSIAEGKDTWAEKACIMALHRMAPDEAQSWLRALASDPHCQRLAVIGAGVMGDPIYIPWLITLIDNPRTARIAGASLASITGVDIALEDLEGPWPEGFTAGPTEDPDDENVAMDIDEHLPWPDAQLVRQWWQTHHTRFRGGSRYLLGKAVSTDWLQQVLVCGLQHQRKAAALELALTQSGPLFEVRAPGFRQAQVLDSMA